MKKISLTQNKYVLVDNEDFDCLNQWEWCLSVDGYAVRSNYPNKNSIIRMHRFLLNTKKGQCVDHINENKLDNRRKNIRLCSKAENLRNKGITKANKSGFKGVYWEKYTQKWRASIGVDGKDYRLGRFGDIKEAVKAYNKAALVYHGEFAKLNTI